MMICHSLHVFSNNLVMKTTKMFTYLLTYVSVNDVSTLFFIDCQFF